MLEKKPAIGVAVKITEDNRHILAYLNNGVVPEVEDIPLYGGSYFIFPYHHKAQARTLPGYVFWQNYAFVNSEGDPIAETTEHFVEIVEI